MSKQFVIPVLFASMIAACAADEPELVEVTPDKADTWNTTPRGNYKFDETLNGAPSSGDLLTLSFSQNQAFRSTVSDEWSGTTQHMGTYKLYASANGAGYYVDLREGPRTYRYEYSIDVVDNATLWLRRVPMQQWFGMASLGEDCTASGCGAGETCTECWGENVCMPDGTSC